MNLEKGRPYGHREDPPSFEQTELKAYVRNIDWIRSHDPYAALLVSMHRTGLWKNRYQFFTSPKGRLRERSPETKAVMKDLESTQEKERKALGGTNPRFEEQLWFNYRLLQVYDLLSLYFCCDGYDEDRFKESAIAPVPVSYDSKDEVELRIVPTGANTGKMQPYPFDISPIKFSVRARIIPAGTSASEEACRETYHKASRLLLNFEVTG
jgi:hypothetical protein